MSGGVYQVVLKLTIALPSVKHSAGLWWDANVPECLWGRVLFLWVIDVVMDNRTREWTTPALSTGLGVNSPVALLPTATI